MPNGLISKKSVDALNCPAGKDRYILWDINLAGFGVVVFPSGTKSYVVQYRQNGISRRANLGNHGRLTPEEARSEAKKVLGAVETGSDPIAERKAARGAMTLQEAAEWYLALHVLPKKKKRTADEYQRLLNQYILPSLGGKRLVDLTRSQLINLHMKISSEKPTTANRALAVMSALWGWATKHEIVSGADNPVRGLEKNKEQGCERYLTGEELQRLGAVLTEAATLGLPMEIDVEGPNAKHAPPLGTRRAKLDPFAAAAITLLLLTGARLREILHLKWADVDLDRGILFLADSKTGKKSIYLSIQAIEVLSQLPHIEGNSFVIAGGNAGKPRSDLKRPWAAIKKAAKLEGVRIHDWRHTFASVAVGENMGLPLVGKLLGHANQATTQRYAHLDSNPLRRAADTIGAKMVRAMSPTNPEDEPK